MGWGRGQNDEGREVGYLIQAPCDFEGCLTTIDLGLGYLCGDITTAVTFGGEGPGCGGYFCAAHLQPMAAHNCQHRGTG